jgi:two-component system alkaline phosphatase synthesis response regulator PhoP
MEQILVIEDDRDVEMAVRRVFESAGYGVDHRDDGNAGLECARASRPSAIVLDLTLPGRSGKDICRELKTESPSLPVVILSAVTDVSDKVLLLELGADDYVTKPFSPRELLARVQAAIRRTHYSPKVDAFNFGKIAVDFQKMELVREGIPVDLTPQEFKLLRFMITNQGRVISREELLNQVWGYEKLVSSRTVDNHVLRLRQKTSPEHFITVHSAGYKFVP